MRTNLRGGSGCSTVPRLGSPFWSWFVEVGARRRPRDESSVSDQNNLSNVYEISVSTLTYVMAGTLGTVCKSSRFQRAEV